MFEVRLIAYESSMAIYLDKGALREVTNKLRPSY
jgi:hypothetical protein